MSKEIGQSEEGERKTLPIEKGFPIEKVNEIAEKEGWAKQYYRPTYAMHKWWARRLGSVFRSICLYTLVDDPSNVTINQPGKNRGLEEFDNSEDSIESLLDSISLGNPDSLWDLYTKDINIGNKKVLDPFMGGGTTVGEASRFGADVTGTDLNPVAWFVTKKEMDGYSTDLDSLQESFDTIKNDISEDIKRYYKTKCPNAEGEDEHKADVMYYFWVKELGCTSCGESVSLFNDYRIGKGRYSNKGTYNVICPSCESIFHVDDWRSECKCPECTHEYTPQEGNVDRGYICTSCGQKYGIVDAIQEQNGFDTRLYALEYHCPTCEERNLSSEDVKSYKPADEHDISLFEEAKKEWEDNPDLREYIPSQEIPLGIMTDSTQFEGNIGGGHNLLRHGYDEWSDLYNKRQLLSMSKLLKEIDKVESQNEKEYLLLAFSQALNYNTMMIGYHSANNQITNIFKSNSFDPPHRPTENNLWGAKDGTGTYRGLWKKIRRGIEYAHSPIERYIEDGESKKTGAFQTPIGQNTELYCRDMRQIDPDEKYDAVITDPPYYDNIIYSEISEYFYVWQRILLEDEYEAFSQPHTPRSGSIVANPAQQKDAEVFENEIGESFDKINDVLKKDGALVFSYHHSNSESWGELLTGLCDSEFEVTATYPISADIQKLVDGESVSFDIIVVARPAKKRTPISWNSLRRNIYRTAKKTRQRLEENRDLSRGDIGVVEMGRCFHEYSKHHGKVERAGETMTAKEVVDEIYGVIQHGSDIGEIDVFLDLLETPNASYDDLNKLSRGTNATPERMEDMRLYRMDDGFKLGTWDDEKRIAYIQSRVNSDKELTDLDKAQFLRYRWEHGKSISEYLSTWEITNNLRELCGGLADATDDDTYRNILESRLSDY